MSQLPFNVASEPEFRFLPYISVNLNRDRRDEKATVKSQAFLISFPRLNSKSPVVLQGLSVSNTEEQLLKLFIKAGSYSLDI